MNSKSVQKEYARPTSGVTGDIANTLVGHGDSFDLMGEMNDLINNESVDGPKEGELYSRQEILNTQIKKEDGSGFITVSSLTTNSGKVAIEKRVGPKKKKGKGKKTLTSGVKAKTGPTLPILSHVKQEPPSSDDEFSEIEQSFGSLDSSINHSKNDSTGSDHDHQKPSTSSGICKPSSAEAGSAANVAHGFKLNATPVVILERLDPAVILQKVSSANESKSQAAKNESPSHTISSESASQVAAVCSEHQSSTLPKQSEKKSATRRSTSSSGSAQASPLAVDTQVDKSRSDAITKSIVKPFLATADHSLSEQSVLQGTTRFELCLSPIVLEDLSAEPFRKFMNLALDCAVHFRKNHNQPLCGHISLYFGDFATLQLAMQRLCQLPVMPFSMRLNGIIRVYDFKRLISKSEDKLGKRSLSGRLMFQFCTQRTEKLKQLASVKERKKESTKMRSALVNKIPAAVSKEMLLLLYPFSLDVRIPGDKQQKGLKGPVSIDFESQEWMEAVMDCMREQSVNINMPSSSDADLTSFHLYVKNHTPPKIALGKPPAASNIPSLMATQMHRGSLANRGRDRGFGAMGRGRGGPGQEQAHSDIDRKRSHRDKSLSRSHSDEKRRRFDDQKKIGTAESEGISKTEAHPRLSQQGTADPKEAIRQAAISKGLDPNNPDVIKILEMTSQLQALQKDQGHNLLMRTQEMSKSGALGHAKENKPQPHFGSRETSRSPRTLSQQRDRDLVGDKAHRGREDAHHRNLDRSASDCQRGGFRNTSRGRDPGAFHNWSPGSHSLQRDRSRSGNRSQSPQWLSSSSGPVDIHKKGFHQQKASAEIHPRTREADKNNSGMPNSYFDPSTNDQPLDFQRPAPGLSTEQAVQQDMARTMQALQHGDRVRNSGAGLLGPVPQQQMLPEEMGLPLQFGKNAVKKTPQAILEEKHRKEHEERQKKERELKKKREDEEKQRRMQELEQRHKKDTEERQKLEERHRVVSYFPPSEHWHRSEGQSISQIREKEDPSFKSKPGLLGQAPGSCAPSEFSRPGQIKKDPIVALPGVRFQGEEAAFSSPRPLMAVRGAWGKDDRPNIRKDADKAQHMQNQSGFSGRGDFQHDGVSFERHRFEESSQSDRPTNIWDAADEQRKEVRDRSPDRIIGGVRPGSTWAEEVSQNQRPSNMWDEHDQHREQIRDGFSDRASARKRPISRWAEDASQNDRLSNKWDEHNQHREEIRDEHPDKTRARNRPLRRWAEEVSQSQRSPYIWDGHDQYREEIRDGQPDRTDARNRLLGRWADDGSQNDTISNKWDEHEQLRDIPPDRVGARIRSRGIWTEEASQNWETHDRLVENADGDHPSIRLVPSRGGPRGRRPVNRIAAGSRGGHGRSMVDWEKHTEHEPEPAPTNVHPTGFRGRGAVRVLRRGAMGAAHRGRGGFGFHSEGHQAQTDWEGPEHRYHNEAVDTSHDEDTSVNTLWPAYQAQKPQRNPPPRGHFDRNEGFSHQDAADYSENNYWGESSGGDQAQRGGYQRAFTSGQHLTGPVRGRGRGRHQVAETEQAHSAWPDAHQSQSNQFEQTGFSEGHVGEEEPAPWGIAPGPPRGRGTVLRRPVRGFMSRVRGIASMGRGFGVQANVEGSVLLDNSDEYRERVSEFEGEREVEDQELRRPMSTTRGGGLNVRGALVGRGLHTGRGAPPSRGTAVDIGAPASRGAAVGRGSPTDRVVAVGRGVPTARGSPTGRGVFSARGVPTSRGAAVGRGVESRGGRGIPLSRGVENRRGRGGLQRQHPDSFSGSLETGFDREQSQKGQFGELYQHGGPETDGLSSRGRGVSEWNPGRGMSSATGTRGVYGHGQANETVVGGAPFRGRARGLLPHPP